MDLIHTSLKVFDKQMAQKKFVCGDHITIFDIMFYNELSQILFLRNKYMKKVEPGLNSDLDENSELMNYENINKWYTRTMPSDETYPKIQAVDADLRESFLRTIKTLN